MRADSEARSFVMARKLGLTDAFAVALCKLKPDAVYSMYAGGQALPVASFRTNPKGMAIGTAIGPMRNVANSCRASRAVASRILGTEAM